MSEVQEGVVKKVYPGDRGGCTVYVEGVTGGLYCNKPYKAEDFPVGATVEFVVKCPAGKGYKVEKIRVKPEAVPTPAESAAKVVADKPVTPTHAVQRVPASAEAERQRMIVVQSCQARAIDLLKIYMEKEAFTLGAAVNKRKAVIDAFFNGLVYDLVQQVYNGPQPLDGKPEDAKPVPKAKAKGKEKAADAEDSSPMPTEVDDANDDQGGLPDMEGGLDDLP